MSEGTEVLAGPRGNPVGYRRASFAYVAEATKRSIKVRADATKFSSAMTVGGRNRMSRPSPTMMSALVADVRPA